MIEYEEIGKESIMTLNFRQEYKEEPLYYKIML